MLRTRARTVGGVAPSCSLVPDPRHTPSHSPMSFYPRTPSRRLWWSFTLLIGFSILGCGTADTSEETPPDYTNVVPVTGTVKANGKPLATAVVTFLPPKWSASNGETDEKGAYSLQTA